MLYLVPEECWYEEHLPGFQNTILTSCIHEVRKQLKVRSFTIDLALHCLPLRAKRVGIQVQKVSTEQSHLLPEQTNLVSGKIYRLD